jgi:6-phosphogluconolactonase
VRRLVDPAGKNAILANYSGGTSAWCRSSRTARSPSPSAIVEHAGHGPNPKRQDKPHPHSINLDPSGKLALVCDLGLDEVKLYEFDPAAGMLTTAQPAVRFDPARRRAAAYRLSSEQQVPLREQRDGHVRHGVRMAGRREDKEIQTISTLTPPANRRRHHLADRSAPTGKFLYVANRGENDITSFSIDQSSGKLTVIGQTPVEGKIPRHFAIDPSGKWLIVANQGDDKVGGAENRPGDRRA